jgi:hypothetical protein
MVYIMTLDELKKQWTEDCQIDDIELDNASLEVPKLHAKYQDLLTSKILVLKQYQNKYNELLKDKWLWYNGKMDEETVREKGWEPDPFNGLKIMKNDMQIFFNADKVTVDFLKECMQNITWRHQTIRNTIDWRKFMAGQ